MKKRIFVTAIVAVMVLTMAGCGSSSGSQNTSETQDGSIESIVKEFYETGYDYVRVEVGANGSITYEGQLFVDPYREHVTITPSGDYTASYNEATYEENGNKVTATLAMADGSEITQEISRTYPDGYGQEIAFTEGESTELNGEEVQIYYGTYQIDAGTVYGVDDLVADIDQTYYVNNDNQIVRIETDKTEYNEYLSAALDVSANGLTRDEALEQEKNSELNYSVTTLDISNYGNPTDF